MIESMEQDSPQGNKVSDTSQDELFFDSKYNYEDVVNIASDKGMHEFNFIITAVNENLPLNSPVAIYNDLNKKIKHNKNIKFLKITRNKNLFIKVSSKICALEVLKLTHILSIAVDTRLLYDNLLSKCVIKNVSADVELQDIFKALKAQSLNALSIRRFSKTVSENCSDKRIKPLNTILVNCIGKFPEEVIMFHFIYNTESFNESPRQCRKCQRYGHSFKVCRSKPRCGKCSEEHETIKCTSEIVKCAQCNLNHPAYSKDCAFYIKEQEVHKIKSTNNISWSEARELLKKRESCKSFAKVVSSNTVKSNEKSEIEKSLLDTILKTQDKLTNNISELCKTVSDMQKQFLALSQSMTVFVNEFRLMKAATNINFNPGESPSSPVRKNKKVKKKASSPSQKNSNNTEIEQTLMQHTTCLSNTETKNLESFSKQANEKPSDFKPSISPTINFTPPDAEIAKTFNSNIIAVKTRKF